MICKYCGKEIDDNSKFCNNCGAKIEKGNEIVDNFHEKNNYTNSKKNGKGILVFISIILFFTITIYSIIKLNQNSDSPGNLVDKLTERDINSSDYSVSKSQGLTTYTITIYAKNTIKYCNVEVKLYDDQEKLLYADTQTKNNLIKGSSYAYTFDFGVTNAISGSLVYYKITGKCAI